MRVGLGQDRHRLVAGGPLLLAGIEIPCDLELDGHSDADVVLHAITDALLGAVALGDIGELFPDTDEANEGRDSSEMLGEVLGRIQSLGWAVMNLDIVVHAQRPRLLNYKPLMRRRIAELLAVDPSAVSLKAKTGERVGVVGRQEAIDCHCVVLVGRSD